MQKPQLLLLPGLNCTGRLWQAQVEDLRDVADAFIPDMTRHERIGELAEAILDQARPRFALAGLSMGGYIALEIMRRAPERVERLALVNTQARGSDPARDERRFRLIALAETGAFDKVLAIAPWTELVAESRAVDRALGEVIARMALDAGAAAFVRQQRVILSRPDSLDGLASIRCPTLVISGVEDTLTPPAVGREMADRIGGSQFLTIADCGHLSPLERPEAVNAAFRAWLSVR